MKIKDLIAKLSKFDEETEVGGVVVRYTEHGSDCGDYQYGCYCSSEDHTFDVISISKQEKPRKTKNGPIIVEKIWIRGDL